MSEQRGASRCAAWDDEVAKQVEPTSDNEMLLKTILNRLEKHSCFVYGDPRFEDDALIVPIQPRANSRAVCSGCGRPGGTYDTAREPRKFQFVPLWGIAVFFVYFMRRVNCSNCGVKVETVPWAQGKSPITTSFAWFPPNSTNQGGELYAVGSRRVTDNNITLAAVQLPQNEMGLFLASRTSALPAVPPGSEGSVCLGGDIGRFSAPDEVRDSGPAGRFDLRLDLGAIPISTQDVAVVTGETWYFQAWYRDETSARTSNFTDAIEITWE